MSGFIPKRIHEAGADPGYEGQLVKLPAAASCPLRDDRALDAGAAMIYGNNLAHLAAASHRHLGWWANVGGSLLITHATSGTVQTSWYGYADGTAPPAGMPQDQAWLIAWDARSARRFGPHFAIHDRAGDRGEALPRKVRVKVRVVQGSGTTLTVICAITPGFDPSPPFTGYAAISATTPATGTATVTLAPTAPIPALDRVPCRAGSSTLASRVRVAPFHVWVGWHATHASDRVLSISAFEVP